MKFNKDSQLEFKKFQLINNNFKRNFNNFVLSVVDSWVTINQRQNHLVMHLPLIGMGALDA